MATVDVDIKQLLEAGALLATRPAAGTLKWRLIYIASAKAATL